MAQSLNRVKHVYFECEDQTVYEINITQDVVEEKPLSEELEEIFPSRIECGSVMQADSDVHMNIYTNAEKLSDFTIKTSSKKFHIHKEILMAHSPKYFELFNERQVNNAVPNEIELKNVPPEVIQDFVLKYLYTGKITLVPSVINDLLSVSTELELNSLKDMCIKYLHSYTADNVLELIPVCQKNQFKELLSEMRCFVYKGFPDIITGSSFAKLDAASLVKLLESYDLRIHGEELIFRTVMLWLSKNPSQMEEFALKLFDTVHFYCVSPTHIAFYTNIHSEVLNVPACKKRLSEAYRYHALEHEKSRAKMVICKPQVKENRIKRIIVTFGGSSLTFIAPTQSEKTKTCAFGLEYRMMAISLDNDNDSSSEIWTEYGSLPRSRCFHSLVALKDALFLIGGCNCPINVSKPVVTNKVYRFDIRFRRWREVSPMLIERMCFASVVVRDRIFIFGGINGRNKILESAECYFLQLDKWFLITPMAYARASLCAAALSDNAIIVVGGYTINNNRKDLIPYVECYNIRTNSWSMKSARSGITSACLVPVHGSLYLIGGGQYDDSIGDLVSTAIIEMYVSKHDSWITVASMEFPRLEMGTVVSGDEVYIVGGICTQSHCVLSSTECFNIMSSTVSRRLISLPMPLMGTRVAVINGNY